MRLPPVEGRIAIAGVSAPVRVVRDRWGVPHIFAPSRDDVFLAQGFVQAQDRLFQMDLWRRSSQGRLAEVLGANFIERDAMTRRLQYHADPDAEWASYGPETRAIAESFVAGINAWVALARAHPSELFALAGWLPEFWTAADLLNRSDAFDREATIAAAERAGLPKGVVDAVRRAAAPPFFTGLATSLAAGAGPAPDTSGADTLANPSPYYLVHLHTPLWSAIGATRPWRPGVAAGHDGSATFVRVEPRYPAEVHAVALGLPVERTLQDTVAVKGRAEPFAFETRLTARGVVVATDRAANLQFTLDWPGFTVGSAPAFAANSPAPAGENAATVTRSGDGAVVFQHPLAITTAARRRFNIGPLARPADRTPPFSLLEDRNVWDASRAMNAPGQSEWRDSAHYADLAALWSSGAMLTLVYSEDAVKANAESTLTLVPDRRR